MKLKQNSEKDLNNRQLQLSWVGAKLNENFIFMWKNKVTPKNSIVI